MDELVEGVREERLVPPVARFRTPHRLNRASAIVCEEIDELVEGAREERSVPPVARFRTPRGVIPREL